MVAYLKAKNTSSLWLSTAVGHRERGEDRRTRSLALLSYASPNFLPKTRGAVHRHEVKLPEDTSNIMLSGHHGMLSKVGYLFFHRRGLSMAVGRFGAMVGALVWRHS